MQNTNNDPPYDDTFMPGVSLDNNFEFENYLVDVPIDGTVPDYGTIPSDNTPAFDNSSFQDALPEFNMDSNLDFSPVDSTAPPPLQLPSVKTLIRSPIPPADIPNVSLSHPFLQSTLWEFLTHSETPVYQTIDWRLRFLRAAFPAKETGCDGVNMAEMHAWIERNLNLLPENNRRVVVKWICYGQDKQSTEVLLQEAEARGKKPWATLFDKGPLLEDPKWDVRPGSGHITYKRRLEMAREKMDRAKEEAREARARKRRRGM